MLSHLSSQLLVLILHCGVLAYWSAETWYYWFYVSQVVMLLVVKITKRGLVQFDPQNNLIQLLN